MMAALSEAAARMGEGSFGRWWNKAGEVLNCAIPIALVIIIAVGLGAILFDFVH